MGASSYGVLFVCTGNICRSPTAEGLFRHRARAAGQADRFLIDSAGTHGYHAGEPPDLRSIAAALTRGFEIDDLRARLLTAEDFHRFNLILAMDEGHMTFMKQLAPPGSRAALRMFLDYAPHTGLQSVPDPYYGGARDFNIVLDLVEQGVDGLFRQLAKDA